MSDRFTFICVKTSADFVVPTQARDLNDLTQKVATFSRGLIGGILRVGTLVDYPKQDPVPRHLLCDGSTISRAQFPELVDYLAGTGADEAALPDYTGPVTISTPTEAHTVTDSGTIESDTTVVGDQGDVGGADYPVVLSDGRIVPARIAITDI